MGRQRSAGEMVLSHAVSQPSISTSPTEQAKTTTRAPRTSRTNAKKGNKVGLDLPITVSGERDRFTIKTHPRSQKEKQSQFGQTPAPTLGKEASSSSPSDPPSPPMALSPVPQREEGRPRVRNGRRAHRKGLGWRTRKSKVEETPLPLLPQMMLPPMLNEDWEEEIRELESTPAYDQYSMPYDIEDIVPMAMMNLGESTPMDGCGAPPIYVPSIHHMPPIRWRYGTFLPISGQFSDAEE